MTVSLRVRVLGCVLFSAAALAIQAAFFGADSLAHVGSDQSAHHISSGSQAGICEAAGMITIPGVGACTHGDDPMPPWVSAGEDPVPVANPVSTTAGCIGNGTSGQRVQVIYARASDVASRYATFLPSFRTWAEATSTLYNNSAAKTGGGRLIRFVHDGSCVISVLEVVVSPTGDDSFPNLIGELSSMGYGAADRKYLIFADMTVGGACGTATAYPDDQPGLDNYSNTNSGWGAAFSDCWADVDTTAHELAHTLGAVQQTAPHGTAKKHCTDAYDLMCYVDAPETVVTVVCADPANYYLLDCNNDDYFHTNPPVGNYLATHWNIANSGFLEKIDPSISLDKASSKYNGWVTATLSGFSPGSTITLRWPGGAILVQVTANSSGSATAKFRTPLSPLGDYTVTATDANSKSASAVLRVIPRILLNETQGLSGASIRVYFYGFAPGEQVEVRFYNAAETSYKVLGTITIASNGRGSKVVKIPTRTTVGNHKIMGKVVGISRSASTTFNVTGLGSSEDPTATPTATATATISPTIEITETAVPTPELTATPAPTDEIAPTETPTFEVPTETPTVDIPTEEPVPTETPVPQETPTESPVNTPIPTIEPTADVVWRRGLQLT